MLYKYFSLMLNAKDLKYFLLFHIAVDRNTEPYIFFWEPLVRRNWNKFMKIFKEKYLEN